MHGRWSGSSSGGRSGSIADERDRRDGSAARTNNGYTVKFRQGIADLVLTIDEGTFEELSKMENLLDEVRGSFLKLRP